MLNCKMTFRAKNIATVKSGKGKKKNGLQWREILHIILNISFFFFSPGESWALLMQVHFPTPEKLLKRNSGNLTKLQEINEAGKTG